MNEATFCCSAKCLITINAEEFRKEVLMNIAICDNDVTAENSLENLLEFYFLNKTISYRINQYSNASELLYEVEDGRNYNIIFLNMIMDGMLGIDTAKILRKINYNGEIIFLSENSEYAVESYDVNAVGYILKPIDYEKLCLSMERAIRNINVETYLIRRRNSFITVPYDEITYIESSNSKCILHRSNGDVYVIYKKLSEIEVELNDKRFLRSHQSYIVNMDYIVQATNQFELSTGEVVLIRQRNIREIRSAYLDYSMNHCVRYMSSTAAKKVRGCKNTNIS